MPRSPRKTGAWLAKREALPPSRFGIPSRGKAGVGTRVPGPEATASSILSGAILAPATLRPVFRHRLTMRPILAAKNTSGGMNDAHNSIVHPCDPSGGKAVHFGTALFGDGGAAVDSPGNR